MKNQILGFTLGLALLGAVAMATAQAQIYTTLDDGVYGTAANGISGNNIVGTYLDDSGNSHGFLYNGSTYTALNDGVHGTFANGISGNNIVGYYYDSSYIAHGFLYDGSTYTTLDDPNGDYGTYAYAIDGNNIVGSYIDSFDSSGDHGFIVSVPEPSVLAVAGLGGLSLLLFRRRKS